MMYARESKPLDMTDYGRDPVMAEDVLSCECCDGPLIFDFDCRCGNSEGIRVFVVFGYRGQVWLQCPDCGDGGIVMQLAKRVSPTVIPDAFLQA